MLKLVDIVILPFLEKIDFVSIAKTVEDEKYVLLDCPQASV